MGWYYAVNQKMLTCGQSLYQLLVALQAAGWTVLGSGDGTAGNYNSTGNLFTNGNHSSYGVFNVGSWWRIQSPVIGSTGQKREFVFQNGGTATTITIRIKYSPNVTGTSGGFTGGSPSASRAPSATDEVVITGGGTDAAPTYANWGSLTDYQFSLQIVCDNDGDAGYSWYFSQVDYNQAYMNGANMCLDIMRDGTFDTADTDPAVIYWASSGLGGFAAELGASGPNTFGFVGSITPANFVSIALVPILWNGGFAIPAAMGNNNWSNDDICVTAQWMRNTPPYAFKGYSSLMKWAATPRGNCYVEKINPNSGGDHITQQGTLLPFAPNTPFFVA